MPTHFQLSWVRAVKEWNQHQPFHDDIYAIPKKGGDSYKEVVSLREEFKRQHNAPPVSEKKAEAAPPAPSAEPQGVPKIESPKKENVGPKKKIDMSQVKEEAPAVLPADAKDIMSNMNQYLNLVGMNEGHEDEPRDYLKKHLTPVQFEKLEELVKKINNVGDIFILDRARHEINAIKKEYPDAIGPLRQAKKEWEAGMKKILRMKKEPETKAEAQMRLLHMMEHKK